MPTKKTTNKAAPKRAPSKPIAKTRVTRAKAVTAPEMQSFRPTSRTEPFMTFRLTNQSLYWLILSIIVLALGIWVTVVTIRVNEIYDSIDRTNESMLRFQIGAPNRS